MDISVSHEQGRRPVAVLHVTGAINSDTHTALEEKAREVFVGGAHDMIVDLANCDYVSSAGIRALNAALVMLRTDAPEESNEAMNKGVRDGTWKSPHLKLANVAPRVQDVLKMAGIDMLIEMHGSVQAAVDSF